MNCCEFDKNDEIEHGRLRKLAHNDQIRNME
jgi:hypothetical protein